MTVEEIARLPDDENDALGVKLLRHAELKGYLQAAADLTDPDAKSNAERLIADLVAKQKQLEALDAEIRKLAGNE